MSEPLNYLRREVAQERARCEQIQDPLQQARALDLIRFFERRLDVAALIEREKRSRAIWGTRGSVSS